VVRRRRHHGMPTGFVSKAQWHYFFANPRLRRYAHKEAHKVIRRRGRIIGYRSLPYRKHVRKRI
jgi:hypothetical protein